MEAKLLAPAEINAALEALPRWSGDERSLRATYEFRDFRGAMRFYAACVEPIEALGHHPTWTNTYGRVDVVTTTHDLGNRVSTLDVALARLFDELVRSRGEEFGAVR
ncbi:MAG: 4a-hydroxytetrahydrobiopterin dehydratase [Myxococcales bacterium]|nr:4a-hydroxytetrahydrobiopterin dehydratase [Myxococcales bacterium]